jgi:NagD protein
LNPPKSYLVDMDGVLVTGSQLIPGADLFVRRLQERGARYLVVTNNSMYTQADLQHRFRVAGLEIPAAHFYTSALATARFLDSQRPRGTAYAIGAAGLTTALHDVGYVLSSHQPDYVVLGETTAYSYEQITQAVRLIRAGARFVATNPDPNGPAEGGIAPATGAVAALIERASGIRPYYVGKPNPLMMRTALRYLQVHSEDSVMVGDRMDTDVVAGLESGMETILVLTGVTRPEQVDQFAYRPSRILDSVAEIEV